MDSLFRVAHNARGPIRTLFKTEDDRPISSRGRDFNCHVPVHGLALFTEFGVSAKRMRHGRSYRDRSKKAQQRTAYVIPILEGGRALLLPGCSPVNKKGFYT
jgi:hypothetical protein